MILQEFIKYLNDKVGTTVSPISLYVWGGQGQYITADGKVFNNMGGYLGEVEAWVKKVETSTNNANRVIKLYKKIRSNYKGYIRCFDCSGLGTFFLYNLHQLISSDKNANGLKGMCQKLTKDKLRKGDWVFRVYSSGRAYHVGYIVNDNLEVIEARGRDYGVVKRPFDSKYWNYYGRPGIFKDEIEREPEPSIIFTRVIKRTSPTMTGDDVKALQTMLNEANGANLATDGRFGPATEKAVKSYQKLKGLVVDGKAGKNTITALGGIWKK